MLPRSSLSEGTISASLTLPIMYLSYVSLFRAYLKSSHKEFSERAASQFLSHLGTLSAPHVVLSYITSD